MSTPEHAQRLAAFLARLRERFPEPGPPEPPPPEPQPTDAQRVHELVRAFLVWEAGERRARAALESLASSLVDFNELRVCLPGELRAILGADYPLLEERCQRLRATLNDLVAREHSLTLEAPARLGKREARAYLWALEGMTPFVADRLTLLVFGGHAFPADARLTRRLAADGVLDPGEAPEHAAAWLERQVHAGEAAAAYRLLERWADEAPAPASSRAARAGPRPRRKAGEP